MDRFTMSAYFISANDRWSMNKLANAYMKEVVRLNGVPLTIVSDRDSRFMPRFWRRLREELGMKLCLSTTYHLQWKNDSNCGRYAKGMYPGISRKLG